MDLRKLLEDARTIELIDWAHQDIPATLDRAGFTVVGHEPSGFKSYVVGADPKPEGSERSFPLKDGAYLVTLPIDGLPAEVDIVATYRPADEQPEYARDAIAHGAKALWIQPGEAASDEARAIAEAAGLAFVDGACIAATVRDLGIRR